MNTPLLEVGVARRHLVVRPCRAPMTGGGSSCAL
ncbi:hypothetical protein BC739_002535 [Kutzneria viridogrisea]|uniref:Uncharacterized protein n=1 Tax=Kutzneria viridogrisea TaxID=47990 RepID=A0ABR6BEP7_9PSEU|nr:hypothetical protein [Kutzneria viridogrisea]